MGIKISELIKARIIDYSELYGKFIAIDAHNIISALINFSRKKRNIDNQNIIIDRTQRPISHLYGLLFRVLFYYSKKIFPIFCFDGRDSALKRHITKDILNDFRYSSTVYEEAMKRGNYNLARYIANGQDYFWHNIIKESKELLNAIGIPIINAPASAESQCAQLVKDGIAHYSNTQDYDSLLFGCPRTIQNLSKSRRRKQNGRWIYDRVEPIVIDLKENLKRMGISQFQLIDMAILIGTDYFRGIRGLGSKTAYNLIKEHGGLEQVMKKEKNRYDFAKLTPDIIGKVRKIFLLSNTISDFDLIFWNYPDESRIKYLLCKEHHLSEERVVNNIKKLEKYYNQCLEIFKIRKNIRVSYQKTLDMIF